MLNFARFALVAAVSTAATAASPQSRTTETAILAGGCFWGVEAVFEHVKGVDSVVSGYAGGSAKEARYDLVSRNRTGHSEAVKIRFDPQTISYAQLLQIYFTVAHDPTQVNRQGPDVGRSYRSAVYPRNGQQRAIATSMIARLDGSKRFDRPIATKIEGGNFYPAEPYHQDFARRNPNHGYIVAHDRPKVAKLKRTYPQWWKA